MKYRNVARNFGRKVALASAVPLALAGSQVFAAVTTIDASEATGQIAEGGSSAGTIGIAMVAFCILIGVLVKLRRAGS